jgi:hypothetical protein
MELTSAQSFPSFPRSAWECSLGRSSGPNLYATLERRDLLPRWSVGARKGENVPIGIILSRHKDELLVEYATYQMNSQLFVQKYQLYLPEREELRRELELTLREAGR